MSDVDFDQVASEAWKDRKTPLEKMYDTWVGEGRWEPDPPQVTYRIYDVNTGMLIRCHLEGCTDRWILDGLESRGIATVFVCDHGCQVCGPQAAIPKISTVPFARVGRYERIERNPWERFPTKDGQEEE